MATTNATAAQSSIISVGPLGFPFKTPNPFLFAVYHLDHYPADKSGKMHAPRRGNGSDFDWSAPFRMYHGERIPGFPQHPHRGFETISIVLGGACDHSDSLGNTGRFGHPNGDLQVRNLRVLDSVPLAWGPPSARALHGSLAARP